MQEIEAKIRILNSAEVEFSEKGVEGARIDSIAGKAKVNKAMLYYYFGNKEELYSAVLENIFAAVTAQASKIIEAEHDDPVHMLDKFIDFYFEFLTSRPNLPKIMLRELASGGNKFREIAAKFILPTSMKARDAIREGVEKGILNRVDPALTIFSIIAPIIFFFVNRPIIETILQTGPEDGLVKDRYRENIKKVVLRGILKDGGAER